MLKNVTMKKELCKLLFTTRFKENTTHAWKQTVSKREFLWFQLKRILVINKHTWNSLLSKLNQATVRFEIVQELILEIWSRR